MPYALGRAVERLATVHSLGVVPQTMPSASVASLDLSDPCANTDPEIRTSVIKAIT